MLLLAPPAAAPGPPAVGLPPLVIEGEASAELRTRIEDSVRTGLAGAPFALREVAAPCPSADCHRELAAAQNLGLLLRVSATANEPDYAVRFDIVDAPSAAVLVSDDVVCEICSHEDLGLLVEGKARSLVGTIAQSLAGRASVSQEVPAEPAEPAAEPGPAPPPTLVEPAADRPAPAPTRAGTVRKVLGGVSLGLAAGAIGGGIALIALDEANYGPKCSAANTDINGVCEFRYATQEGGIALTAGGVVLAITGVTLLSVAGQRGQHMQVALQPRGISLRGAF
jgi:hypothetical protein